MNKQQEIAELKRFIKMMQESGDSYVGQWLREQLPHVESALKSDLYPSVNCIGFIEFGERREAILKTARLEAEAITREATRQAKITLEAASNTTDSVINNLQSALRAMQQ